MFLLALRYVFSGDNVFINTDDVRRRYEKIVYFSNEFMNPTQSE